ncbi:MAG TPA: ABC transporter permease [Vicinamibacterales bacterium]
MTGERWFRRLLRILPGDFRADYGGEMEQVFRDQVREAAAQGRTSVMRVWAEAVASLFSIGPREHLAQLRQDVRYALRGMAAHPSFTAVAVLTLALGIGANTAIFSVAYAVLLRPLPYGAPERLVAVANRWDGRPAAPLSDQEYMDYSEQSRTLAIAAAAAGPANVSDGRGNAERIFGAAVTANAFDVLGVQPVVGRVFRVEEEQGDGANVAIISDALWQVRFNRDPAIVGRTITIDDQVCDIVGVAPPKFRLPLEFGAENRIDVFRPLGLDRAASRAQRGGHYLDGFARLQQGSDVGAARSEMDAIIGRLIAQYPDQHTQGHFGIAVSPLRDELLGSARPVMLVLGGAVALVLLIACANVANLLLARGAARRRELALRTALGASRFRLVRQLLTEAWLLSGAGAIAGLAVALWGQALVVNVAPTALPRATDTALNTPVLVCAALLGIVAGVFFGLIPALQVSRARTADPLKDGARGSTDSRTLARRVLVVAQVAVAVLLLVGAGLLIKSFSKLMNVRSGFDADRVLTVRVSLPEVRYPGRPEVTGYFERLRGRLASLPGVESTGAASGLPLAVASGDWSFDLEGRAPLNNKKHWGAADWYAVTPGYFETLKIPVLRGRGPSDADTAGATPVIFVNETTARTLFPGDDPIGKRIQFSRSRGFEQPWRTIAGIVGDVRQRGLDTPARPEVYFPHAQFQHFSPNAQARSMVVVLKTAGDPSALAQAVRATVRELDPEVPAAQTRAMTTVIASSVRDRRLNMMLIGGFGVLALVLASVGLYGVLAFQVTERTREMGVRLALGASRGAVLRMIVGQGLRLVAIGLAAGVGVAAWLSSAVAPMLFEVAPRDVSVFLLVPATLFAAGLLACYIPARRAMRVDPVTALRAE